MLSPKNGILFAIIVAFSFGQTNGQTSIRMSTTDDANQVNSTYLGSGPYGGTTFLPLIDDVMVKVASKQHGQTSRGKSGANCELNAPLPTATSSSSMQFRVTPKVVIQCECPTCQASENGAPNCLTCTQTDGSSCPREKSKIQQTDEMKKYCRQVAALLRTTLHASAASTQARQSAIEAALEMVVAKANHESEQRVAKLTADHEQALDKLKKNRASLVEPIYATQYRNARQLEQLTAANRSMQRSMLLMEQQLASFSMTQRAKLSNSEVKRMMESVAQNEQRALEVEKLEAELKALDSRIRQLKMTPGPVQPMTLRPIMPATYLEPVYAPDRQLQPMRR